MSCSLAVLQWITGALNFFHIFCSNLDNNTIEGGDGRYLTKACFDLVQVPQWELPLPSMEAYPGHRWCSWTDHGTVSPPNYCTHNSRFRNQLRTRFLFLRKLEFWTSIFMIRFVLWEYLGDMYENKKTHTCIPWQLCSVEKRVQVLAPFDSLRFFWDYVLSSIRFNDFIFLPLRSTILPPRPLTSHCHSGRKVGDTKD